MPLLWKQIASLLMLSLLLLDSSAHASESSKLVHPCDSEIYCYGELLHTVQMAELYNDSKHFVDMSLKYSQPETLRKFDRLMNFTNGNPSKDEVQAFVDANFLEPSSEFVDWTPTDWEENPEFLSKIEDPELEEWAKALNELWKHLGRQTSTELLDDPEKSSLLYLPHPVIVPGGRFREVYYWDSYWTMEGLLLSGMKDTAKGMLQNFLQLVETYGMVPNGGRVYYTRRSQPPYLIPMVKMYVDYTQDEEFVRDNIHILAKEFQFWEANRKTAVRDLKTEKVYQVSQYYVKVDDPRPESYKEDFNLANNLTSEEEKSRLYVQLKSGAESGWDYSTRWFVKGDSNKGNLSDLNVTSIAPIDLNSLLCTNARILSDFYKKLGNEAEANKYDDLAAEKNQTLADLFWDEEEGTWFDLNINTMKKRKFFYLSNVHPIWGGCFGLEGKREDTMKKVINYLHKKKAVDYIGGIPTSMKNSGEQWDYPNAWAPLQHIAIMGLFNQKSLDPDAEPLSFELAEKWVRSNYQGYQEEQAMFEKYDVNIPGAAGRGGEYDVQLGFGWSNGVAMKFLDTFGDRLTATTGGSTRNTERFSMLLLLPTIVLAYLSSKGEL